MRKRLLIGLGIGIALVTVCTIAIGSPEEPSADLVGPRPTATTIPAPTATPQPTEIPAPTVQPTAAPAVEPTAIPTIEPTPTPVPTSTPDSALWRGLVIAPENRCSEYDSDDYRYSRTVEDRIVAELGAVYSPYTGQYFASQRETDIEHIVARSEAHDSGLCAADGDTRRAFSNDLLNLTLASPSVNRHQKSDKDAAEWLPELNECWFVDRVIQVRVKYELTIDQREAAAIDVVLALCASTELAVLPSDRI